MIAGGRGNGVTKTGERTEATSPLVHQCRLPLSTHTVNHLAALLRRHLKAIRYRWRILPPGKTAVIVLAVLRHDQRLADTVRGSPVYPWGADVHTHDAVLNDVTACRAPGIRGGVGRRPALLRGECRADGTTRTHPAQVSGVGPKGRSGARWAPGDAALAGRCPPAAPVRALEAAGEADPGPAYQGALRWADGLRASAGRRRARHRSRLLDRLGNRSPGSCVTS